MPNEIENGGRGNTGNLYQILKIYILNARINAVLPNDDSAAQ